MAVVRPSTTVVVSDKPAFAPLAAFSTRSTACAVSAPAEMA